MKKIFLPLVAVALLYVACNKSDSADSITLTATATETTVGQTVAVTASTTANTISWSSTPPTGVNKSYAVTTEKTNYFTFSQPGEYIIGVRARTMKLDSIHRCNFSDSVRHHGVDSIWNHHVDSMWHQRGHHLGGCRNKQDSASIVIKVK